MRGKISLALGEAAFLFATGFLGMLIANIAVTGGIDWKAALIVPAVAATVRGAIAAAEGV